MRRRKTTILCVDDERNQLLGRKVLLEESGYRVLTATSGRDGLELFCSHPVDAVILDYQMPGMNGDLVAAQMKRLKSHVPLLLVSGYERVPASALKFVDAFVSKGQSPAKLLTTVHDLLSVRFPFFSRWLGDWEYGRTA